MGFHRRVAYGVFLAFIAASEVGCDRNVRPETVVSNSIAPAPEPYPIEVRPARTPLGVRVPASFPEPGTSSPSGSNGNEPATATRIPCATCHSSRDPNAEIRASADLDEFHQGLTYAHGDQTCISCHHPEDYDSLRRADGRRLPYSDVIALCSQCHGTQARDYENGAHGGAEGFWDLRRGPRTRNPCTHCHDPHAPAYPPMQPTFKPHDRFLRPRAEGEETQG